MLQQEVSMITSAMSFSADMVGAGHSLKWEESVVIRTISISFSVTANRLLLMRKMRNEGPASRNAASDDNHPHLGTVRWSARGAVLWVPGSTYAPHSASGVKSSEIKVSIRLIGRMIRTDKCDRWNRPHVLPQPSSLLRRWLKILRPPSASICPASYAC